MATDPEYLSEVAKQTSAEGERHLYAVPEEIVEQIEGLAELAMGAKIIYLDEVIEEVPHTPRGSEWTLSDDVMLKARTGKTRQRWQ